MPAGHVTISRPLIGRILWDVAQFAMLLNSGPAEVRNLTICDMFLFIRFFSDGACSISVIVIAVQTNTTKIAFSIVAVLW